MTNSNGAANVLPVEELAVYSDKLTVGEFLKKYAIIGILAAMILLLTALTGGKFIAPQNLVNVALQVTPIGIVSIAMTFVIIIKGIDLSVGSIAALAAVVSASLAQLPTAPGLVYPGLHVPAILAVLAGLAVGLACGAFNGGIITGFRIAPFIATLGMMTAARGATGLYNNGASVAALNSGFRYIGTGKLFGVIPVPLIIFALVALGGHILLNYTRFGRSAYAIGGNPVAARVSGISIGRVTFGIFALAGFTAGLAGMILATRTGSATADLGFMMELDVIAAAVIGGTSFNGGIGTAWGSVVGALIIGLINNGLNLMNVSPFMQLIVKGAIIVIAIIIDERKNR